MPMTLTFTLQPLSEEAFEQLLAVLAHSGPCVRVDQEGVGHLDLGEQQLVQLDGSTDVGLRAGAALSAREVLQLVLLLEQTGSSGSVCSCASSMQRQKIPMSQKQRRNVRTIVKG